MAGEHAVGRVIARPFSGEPGAFRRTDGRHDLSIQPPGRTYLDELAAAGVPVHAVGKVSDLFAGRGIDVAHPGATNARALRETTRLVGELDAGLVFTNLVETDQVYGHRKDVEGFDGRCARSTRRWASGSSGCAPATCSSSPPITAAIRRRRTAITRASTSRCSPASTAIAAAATTARWPTSARACCAG